MWLVIWVFCVGIWFNVGGLVLWLLCVWFVLCYSCWVDFTGCLGLAVTVFINSVGSMLLLMVEVTCLLYCVFGVSG